MSFRDQTYLVILNWLCSVDLVSHLGILSCVAGCFNFRPLRKKTIWFPSVYFPLQGYSSTRLVGQCCWLPPCSPLSSSPLPPASTTCSHSPSELKHWQNGCWGHQPGSGSRDGEERWERGMGFPTRYWWGGALGHPMGAIPCDVNDLSLDNRLCSLSLPINEVTVARGGGEGPRPRELTSGGKRWPQAHWWVEIICGRSSCQEMHCNVTGAAMRWRHRSKENAEMPVRKFKTQGGRMS